MLHYSPINLRSFRGKTPRTGERVLIDPSAVVLGDVDLADDVSVWPQVAIRGDMHSITIGARTSVQDGCVLHITHAGPYNERGWPLHIGCDVTIGHNATLHGCTVGDRVLVGMGAEHTTRTCPRRPGPSSIFLKRAGLKVPRQWHFRHAQCRL